MNKKSVITISVLIAIAAGIKIFATYPQLVDQYYSTGLYPYISKTQRFLFGWLPVSIGDILYLALILYLLKTLYFFISHLFKGKITRQFLLISSKKLLRLLLILYITFNILWGLNYDRPGIAAQLHLQPGKITATEMLSLAKNLQALVNKDAALLDTSSRLKAAQAFQAGIEAYRQAALRYSFLQYHPPAVKATMYPTLLNYMGTQGYYNPFTGEAQVNTSIPAFLQPFVATHEMAHQVGYAKESEANFTGWLVCHTNANIQLRYSANLVMYQYARYELWQLDSVQTKSLDSSLHSIAKADIQQERQFYKHYSGKIDALVRMIYGTYLKANKQPAGNRSYNEVVVWLIAYWKKEKVI